MTKRVLLAGLLAGLAMFVWQSIAHMALPFGAVGVQQIANEAAVLGAMQSALGGNSGLYVFPSLGPDGMQGYRKRLAANPSGLLIYHPPGAPSLTAGQLIAEFLTELIESVLAVWLLSRTTLQTFGRRVGFVVVAGIVAALTTNVSYWNWYGFPANYTATYVALQIAGFLAAGLTAAAMLRRVKFAVA